MSIPERPWVSVSMDFISGFLKVDSMIAILVMVDRFLKYTVFIPVLAICTAEVAAVLFFRYLVKHFGLLEDIVSDRDARFTGRFWTALFDLMGMKLKFSTSHHPQIDG